jgi:hypothetical protein
VPAAAGAIEGTFDLSAAEAAHYMARSKFRFKGLFGGVVFLVVAIFAASRAPAMAGTLQQHIDLFLGTLFGILGAYVLISSIGIGILRGPFRLHITLNGLTFDFPHGSHRNLEWRNGLPLRIADLRKTEDPDLLGSPCIVTWGIREFGITGPSCDAILEAASVHGLELRKSGPGLWFTRGTVVYSFKSTLSK